MAKANWGVLLSSLLPVMTVVAAPDQKPIEVTVLLGTSNDPLSFSPNKLEFEVGQSYRLTLLNEGPSTHRFWSPGFAQAVATERVEFVGKEGAKVAEVTGQIQDVVVSGKSKAIWTFIPKKKGDFGDLKCTVAGHDQYGMVGRIILK